MRTYLTAAILMFVIPLFGEVGQWTLVYPENGQTYIPESAFNVDTTVIWDELSFIYDAEEVVRIAKDGSVSEYPLPEIEVPQPSNGLESLYLDQLICADGEYYSLLHFDGFPPFRWKKCKVFLRPKTKTSSSGCPPITNLSKNEIRSLPDPSLIGYMGFVYRLPCTVVKIPCRIPVVNILAIGAVIGSKLSGQTR